MSRKFADFNNYPITHSIHIRQYMLYKLVNFDERLSKGFRTRPFITLFLELDIQMALSLIYSCKNNNLNTWKPTVNLDSLFWSQVFVWVVCPCLYIEIEVLKINSFFGQLGDGEIIHKYLFTVTFLYTLLILNIFLL